MLCCLRGMKGSLTGFPAFGPFFQVPNVVLECVRGQKASPNPATHAKLVQWQHEMPTTVLKEVHTTAFPIPQQQRSTAITAIFVPILRHAGVRACGRMRACMRACVGVCVCVCVWKALIDAGALRAGWVVDDDLRFVPCIWPTSGRILHQYSESICCSFLDSWWL